MNKDEFAKRLPQVFVRSAQLFPELFLGHGSQELWDRCHDIEQPSSWDDLFRLVPMVLRVQGRRFGADWPKLMDELNLDWAGHLCETKRWDLQKWTQSLRVINTFPLGQYHLNPTLEIVRLNRQPNSQPSSNPTRENEQGELWAQWIAKPSETKLERALFIGDALVLDLLLEEGMQTDAETDNWLQGLAVEKQDQARAAFQRLCEERILFHL